MPCSLAHKYQCDGGPFTVRQRIKSQTTVIWLSSWEHRTPYSRPSYRKITFHLVPGTLWSVQVPRHINWAAKFCTGALSVATISTIWKCGVWSIAIYWQWAAVASEAKWHDSSHIHRQPKTPSETSRITNSAVSTSGTSYHLETLATFHYIFVNYCPMAIWNLFGRHSDIRAQ